MLCINHASKTHFKIIKIRNVFVEKQMIQTSNFDLFYLNFHIIYIKQYHGMYIM